MIDPKEVIISFRVWGPNTPAMEDEAVKEMKCNSPQILEKEYLQASDWWTKLAGDVKEALHQKYCAI